MHLREMEKEDLKEVLAGCYASTEMCCKVIFPHIFSKPFSKLHRQIFEILDEDKLQKVAIAAPRGWGKSSILSLAYPAKRIMFQDVKYLVQVSASADLAIEHSENLKTELLTNEYIESLFGSIKSKESFSKEEWITSTGIKVKPRGAGQQIRGRRFGIHRPDLITVDDLEDDEAVLSEDQRRKLKNWFFSSVVNSIDRGEKNWRIIVMGTILHQNSLLNELLGDSSWHTLRLDICNDQYESNWPDYMTTEQIKQLANEYREMDMLDVFYREYRNIPIALESQGFRPSYMRYYDEDKKFDGSYITVILADIAKTMEKGSAFSVIAGISVDTMNGDIYIREMRKDRMTPDELINGMLDMGDRLNALILAPEVTGLNEYVLHPLKTEMIRRGKFYVIIEVKPREGKSGPRRSGGLIPYYKKGKIFHNRQDCGEYERYLYDWPRPARWDDIDAVSGLLFVLEEGKRYFVEQERSQEEDEYEGLRNEEALEMEDFALI